MFKVMPTAAVVILGSAARHASQAGVVEAAATLCDLSSLFNNHRQAFLMQRCCLLLLLLLDFGCLLGLRDGADVKLDSAYHFIGVARAAA